MGTRLDLNGKSAVVTGGSRGIGRAVAITLADAGARVTIADRSDALRNDGLSTSDVIRSRGGHAESVLLDISSSPEVDATMNDIAGRHGIDILVNNAGTIVSGTVAETSDESWRAIFSVNVDGTFYCTRAAIRHMLNRGAGGKIVNIASVSGLRANQGFAAYCAAKGALINFSRQVGIDYGAQGINVNAVAPGFVETEMTAMYDASIRHALEAQTPNGKWATPQQIADTVLFLSSGLSDHLCGEVIAVDGGWLVGTPVQVG
ncbi:3-oxoacyl-[acyl-carrier protein] reductase (plasmid) [Rhodococcus opacus]|uniref:3-oxoacyl-[acyl-carrier protein] reductase n=2 Tax=Rhodococcus TaxID=1827 RepID=A0A1B1KH87_RHOOP|nr:MULTISPECIES: SDR family NAD(P)-dependent oxidoreductase [Rhodococcus]ANS31959.1 3-oxoacyl-[acyl-carrier protein] reductase [Rhodococcus opacus]WAM19565.1 SDR family NAD(P)-dependent oxidoreductase [Rhodococcus sp. JS3073]CCN27364.1 aminoalcohol dehydrogenase [Rhodococcus sp. TMP1]